MWIVLLYAVAVFAQDSPSPRFPGDAIADRIIINSDEDIISLPSDIRALIGSTRYGRPMPFGKHDFPKFGGAGAGEDFADGDPFGIDFNPLEDSSDEDDDNGGPSAASDSRLDLSMFGIGSGSVSEGSPSPAMYTSPTASSDEAKLDTPVDLSMFGIFSEDNNGGSLTSDGDGPSYLPLTGLLQFGIGDDRSNNSDGTAASTTINTDVSSFDFSSFGLDLDDSNHADDRVPFSASTSDDTDVDLSQFGISDYLSGAPDDTDDSPIDLSSFGIYFDAGFSDNDNDESSGMSSDTTRSTSDIIGDVGDDMPRSIDSAPQHSFDLSQFGIRSEDYDSSHSTLGSLLNQRGLDDDGPSIDLSQYFNSDYDSGDNSMGDAGTSYPDIGRYDIFEGLPFMSETKTDPTKQISVSETLSGQKSENLPLEQTDASVIPISTGADPTPSLSSLGIAVPESAINVNDIISTPSSNTAEPSPDQTDTPSLDLKPLGIDLSQFGVDLIPMTQDVPITPQSIPSEQQNTDSASPEVEYNILLDTTGEQLPLVPGFDVIKTEPFDWTSLTSDHGSGI